MRWNVLKISWMPVRDNFVIGDVLKEIFCYMPKYIYLCLLMKWYGCNEDYIDFKISLKDSLDRVSINCRLWSASFSTFCLDLLIAVISNFVDCIMFLLTFTWCENKRCESILDLLHDKITYYIFWIFGLDLFIRIVCNGEEFRRLPCSRCGQEFCEMEIVSEEGVCFACVNKEISHLKKVLGKTEN